jgi:hypothetical protein
MRRWGYDKDIKSWKTTQCVWNGNIRRLVLKTRESFIQHGIAILLETPLQTNQQMCELGSSGYILSLLTCQMWFRRRRFMVHYFRLCFTASGQVTLSHDQVMSMESISQCHYERKQLIPKWRFCLSHKAVRMEIMYENTEQYLTNGGTRT